jgi:hypothetical protein
MANKRIELEHYRHYVDLLAEEPNRKTWRKGMMAVIICAMLLALAFFVLGMLSVNLASNPRNVLEKPPEKAAPTPETVPEGSEFPQQEVPLNIPQTPEGQPSQTPIEVPVTPDQGKAPLGIAVDDASGGHAWGADGALLAQAEPVVPVETVPGEQAVPGEAPAGTEQIETVPGQPSDSSPAKESKKPKKPSGPGQETKGVGNLANMTNGVGGRGFQLYLLVLVVGLLVVLYIALKRARQEGKLK